MLPHCDFLSINAPMTPATRKWVNAERIAKLPKGAVVVNTARGGVVDDEALIAALKSGQLAAAGLDVFDGEPKIHQGYYELRERVPAAAHGLGHGRDAQCHGLQGARQSRGLPAQGAGAARPREGFLAERATLAFLALGAAEAASWSGGGGGAASATRRDRLGRRAAPARGPVL